MINDDDRRRIAVMMTRFFPASANSMREDFDQEAALALLETGGDFHRALVLTRDRCAKAIPYYVIAMPKIRPRLSTCRSLVDVVNLYGYNLDASAEPKLAKLFRQQSKKRQTLLKRVFAGEKPSIVAAELGICLKHLPKETKAIALRLAKEYEGVRRYFRTPPGALVSRGQGRITSINDGRLLKRKERAA